MVVMTPFARILLLAAVGTLPACRDFTADDSPLRSPAPPSRPGSDATRPRDQPQTASPGDDAAEETLKLDKGPDYRGMCDASAGVAVDEDHFIVANDEDNVLRVYRRKRGGSPVASADLSRFLEADPDKPESDIEGAARIGERVYWITSLGRNRNAELRESRNRLFATEVKRDADTFTITAVGRAYQGLLDDLCDDPRLARYNLRIASRLPPKEKGGLNIEGLAATPDGRLLVGFRSPNPRGNALIVPIENPAEVVDGRQARLGDPIELDLGGLGIRSMEYHPQRSEYLLIAGSFEGGGPFRFYGWTGEPAQPPVAVTAYYRAKLNLETMILYPDHHDAVQILSDDGTRDIDGTDCKNADPQRREFRSAWLKL
jgi:hypothetical protein